MVISSRTRFILLGFVIVLICVGIILLTLRFGTESLRRWHSKPCVFPIRLPTILNVTSHLVTGHPGVIKVFVQSDYPIRGYWEERQGYTIGGRTSVSYLIPTTADRGYTSKLHNTGNGKYTLILRMRKTPGRNGVDNFSLHLIQRTPCNTFIMNFDPLELINTTLVLPKILKAPLPTYKVTDDKFSLTFVAKARNNTKTSETFRDIFAGTFVRVSWAVGGHIRSVHSAKKDKQNSIKATSSVKASKNGKVIAIRSHIDFKRFNSNNTGLYTVGFILYTSHFAAIKTEVYTDIQDGGWWPPAVRVESCSDIMSPRIERTNHKRAQELAAVQNVSNCIRVMTSGHPLPKLSLHALRGRKYNNASIAVKPAKSGRPLPGTFISQTFHIKNPSQDRPQYYLVRSRNELGFSKFLTRIALYRPVRLLEFYIEGVPKPGVEMAERQTLWYDVTPKTTATLTCKASGHPPPTIRFFYIPQNTSNKDSVFALDPVFGDPTWTNLEKIDGIAIRSIFDNTTELMTSSVTLKKEFIDGKTYYVIACLAENKFFLNRRKIGFHVVDS